jgi:uncharacterized protein
MEVPEEFPLPPPLAPVRAAERIQILDVLRGAAIGGIFFINLPLFVAPSVAFFGWETGVHWPQPLDRAVQLFLHLFFQGKFYTLFASLFGLGFGMQLVRAAARGTQDFPILYRRRLAWLLVIGLAHFTLFWWGDVLHVYAILGFLLLGLRRIRDSALVSTIIVLLCLPAAGAIAAKSLSYHRYGPDTPTDKTKQLDRAITEIKLYSSGSTKDIFVYRLRRDLRQLSVEAGWSIELFAAFLVGLWAARRRLFDDPSRHTPLLHKLVKIALPAGFLITVADLLHAFYFGREPAPLWRENLSFLREFIARPAMAYGYAAVLLLTGYRPWMRPLAAVGRMALTNYLLHTVVFTTLAYSYGFGLYGRISPAQGIPICLAFLALQAAASQWWLNRFAYGPVEWWWRARTYGTKPRWRIAPPPSAETSTRPAPE